MNQDTILKVDNLSRRYDHNRGIGPVSFSIERGKIYGLIGANGSGKSTLMRCILGLETIDSGRFDFLPNFDFKNSNNSLQNRMSAVLQKFDPWPHLNVIQNISLPLLSNHSIPTTEIQRIVANVIEKFQLAEYKNSFPYELSGGIRQRLSIARALAIPSQLLLLDEPNSALDPKWSEILSNSIKEYRNEGKGVIVSSHSLNFMKNTCDIIFYLDQGFLIESGSPEAVFSHAQNESLIKFLEFS